jgi:hypothetical protein
MPIRSRLVGKSVLSHDVTAAVNPRCNGEIRVGEINRSEVPILISQKAVGVKVDSTHVPADNLTGRIDIEGSGEGRVGEINRGESCFVTAFSGLSSLKTDA